VKTAHPPIDTPKLTRFYCGIMSQFTGDVKRFVQLRHEKTVQLGRCQRQDGGEQ
jgi:hypothetical protein